eukprot:COSAG01_NODE_66196_length_271_cov_0.552326_1_plen_38_part_01
MRHVRQKQASVSVGAAAAAGAGCYRLAACSAAATVAFL